MLNVFLRTLAVYVMLVIAMRVGGKRQVGELQLSELVSVLLLSEIAALPVGQDDIPLTFALIPIASIICIELICAFVVTKSKKLRTAFGGNPSVLIAKGKVNLSEFKKIPMGIEEFISETRLCGISDISEIDYAILEENGRLAVFKKAQSGQVNKGIAHVLVSDGEVDARGLKITGMSRAALEARLEKHGVKPQNVFLYTVNDAGEEYLIRK